MPKVAKQLSALEVRRLTAPGLHFVGKVPGLALQVTPSGSRSWILRITVAGKRRDIGLGAYPGVSLEKAHEEASNYRTAVKKGTDPIAERQAADARLRDEKARRLTFAQACQRYIDSHESGWRNAKHAAQWRATLETYAHPVMGKMQVGDVDTPQVLACLEPIWKIKTETSTRLRGRIEAVLDWAVVGGFRPEGPNPARWKGHLAQMLPAPRKVAKTGHHAALPADQMPAFMERLRAMPGISARAMEFGVLTAARSGEVRGATWGEIDLEAAVWTVPAERMKGGREHRVPLSRPALALLKAVPRWVDNDLVFVAPRGGMLSDMSLTAVTRRMGVEAVPHGFRSTFRDWAAERTHHARDVCELALAHAIESKTEAAYRRGDLFEKRRLLMADWAAFCDRPDAPAEVIPIRKPKSEKTA